MMDVFANTKSSGRFSALKISIPFQSDCVFTLWFVRIALFLKLISRGESEFTFGNGFSHPSLSSLLFKRLEIN